MFEAAMPSTKQEGGDNLNFFQGNVIKYVIRYLNKNKIQDLKKIIHYCELEIDEMKREEWKKDHE